MQTKTQNKYTINNLKSKVKRILFKKGYSHLFIDIEFYNYMARFKNAFNPSLEIAEQFIKDNSDQESDFNQYLY